MTTRWRWLLPPLITLGAVAGLVAYGPIPQLANYHDFADRRVLLDVPHWGDVMSNAGFAFVGVWGLSVLQTLRRSGDQRAGMLGYGVFFGSLLLTAIGSSFYHWAPDNDRLVWDRLPIALACAGLLAAVRAESMQKTHEVAWTVVLAVAAVATFDPTCYFKACRSCSFHSGRPTPMLHEGRVSRSVSRCCFT